MNSAEQRDQLPAYRKLQCCRMHAITLHGWITTPPCGLSLQFTFASAGTANNFAMMQDAAIETDRCPSAIAVCGPHDRIQLEFPLEDNMRQSSLHDNVDQNTLQPSQHSSSSSAEAHIQKYNHQASGSHARHDRRHQRRRTIVPHAAYEHLMKPLAPRKRDKLAQLLATNSTKCSQRYLRLN